MADKTLTQRLAALVLAGALALGGLFASAAFDEPDTVDPTEEVAGATWSFTVAPPGKGGSPNGATWS